MRFLARLLINAVALYVAQALVAGIKFIGDWPELLLVALLFGVLNAVVRPLLKLLTCPLQALTLGLFTLVINAIMLLLTDWASAWLDLGFSVNGFRAALLGAIVVSIVSIVLSIFVRDDDEKQRTRW